MAKRIVGNAHIFGDDINTDYIIAGKYTKTLDYSSLADHLFEDIDPGFARKCGEGDLVAAGRNFGCGSSREQAPIALKHAGVGAVLARSFARIFFRNAINLGLPALLCDTRDIEAGDRLSLDIEAGNVTNHSQNRTYRVEPLPPIMVAILDEGGLVPYLKRHGDFVTGQRLQT
ncbi:MAG: 3-isopropylmalate dehydratase small subunit [Synergistales bacterium]|nr:3-isopropylmalate dehydratase small subunit [Synergistales bacterium]